MVDISPIGMRIANSLNLWVGAVAYEEFFGRAPKLRPKHGLSFETNIYEVKSVGADLLEQTVRILTVSSNKTSASGMPRICLSPKHLELPE